MTEGTLRLSIFLGVLILMGALEAAFPARERVQTRTARWTTNLGLVIIDTLAIRLLFPGNTLPSAASLYCGVCTRYITRTAIWMPAQAFASIPSKL